MLRDRVNTEPLERRKPKKFQRSKKANKHLERKERRKKLPIRGKKRLKRKRINR